MSYVALGCLGFLAVHLFDAVSLKKLPAVKPITWVAGSGLLLYALAGLSLSGERIPVPGWAVWLGWWLFSLSSLLLIYALFINLPLRKTYLEKGVGAQLITTGMYALVRHPGVLWLSLALGSLILISRADGLLIGAPAFILLDVLLVAIQDRFFFVRMFPGYERYRKTTPMLLPNRRSVRAFVNPLFAFRDNERARRKQWRLLSS